MKYLKLFIILVAGTMAMNSFATKTANIKITVTDENVAAPFTPSTYVVITQDDAVAADFSSANNGPYAISYGNSNSINMYVKGTGANIYQGVELPNINGLEIVFKANKNHTSYKMSFSDVQGDIKLMKGETEIPVNADYTITCATEEQVTFTLVAAQVYTRDQLTAGDWGTICLPWSSTALEGATFYEALGTKNDKGIALAEVSALEAGKPYVFNVSEAATEIKVTYDKATEVTAEVAGNKCTGSFAGCNVPKDMYLIVDNKLYKAADGSNTIGANRAYFDVETMGAYQGAPGRKVVFFGGKGAATGLEAAEAPAMNEGKMIINGKLVIIRDGKMFNAQGAQL